MLSTLMWETGRLGAPWEYLNYERDMVLMQARLQVESLDDYLRALTACRTSPNGVFAIKAHYHHFASAFTKSDEMQRLVQGAKYVYIHRQDKLAQAVSLAKALQSRAWFSFEAVQAVPLFYSFEFIKACVDELQRQADSWWLWFKRNDLDPLVISYEELVSNRMRTLEDIAYYLQVEGDIQPSISIPAVERQHDDLNDDWAARFLSDLRRVT